MKDTPLIDPAGKKVVSLLEETRFAENGIVSRTILITPETRAVLFGFAEGQELTEHTSSSHAYVQVLSGACRFQFGGVQHDLKTGDLLYMAPNLPHAVKATGRFSMLLTLVNPNAKNS